jgi:hypothetical protein
MCVYLHTAEYLRFLHGGYKEFSLLGHERATRRCILQDRTLNSVAGRPLLGSDRLTNSETTPITRQRPRDKQIYKSRYWVTASQIHTSHGNGWSTTLIGVLFPVRAEML